MDEIKKIVNKVFVLIIEILLFGYKTIKQVILPGRQKKGNILSSLFIFFVGLIERLCSFEYGVFRLANLLRQKYIKQTLLIIAGILFLLSSLEWTGKNKIFTNSYNKYAEQLFNTEVKESTIADGKLTTGFQKNNCLFITCLASKSSLESAFKIHSSLKTYLLIRSIRI